VRWCGELSHPTTAAYLTLLGEFKAFYSPYPLECAHFFVIRVFLSQLWADCDRLIIPSF
jgi:hypothetical protein